MHSVIAPAAHSLHECRSAADFCERFAMAAGESVTNVTARVVRPTEPQAVFLTGSLPLGMATNGSDVDFIVVIDDNAVIFDRDVTTNTNQKLAFSNDSDPLRAGLFLTVMNGITVEVAVVRGPAVRRTYERLHSKGPELNETEIMTLGRLSTGWLLLDHGDYMSRSRLFLTDPALGIYCSTRHFSYALIYQLKAQRALDLSDIPQALHLGRLGVEAAYLAYFASEGLVYLGAKWLAQVGHARDATQRVNRHPLLRKGIELLFPVFTADTQAVTAYLKSVADFFKAMRGLIEEKMLFRIAFNACPQIGPARG